MNPQQLGKISSRQLIILVSGYLIGSILGVSSSFQAGNAAWLAIILGFVESLLFLFIYLKLCQRYPEQSLLEINQSVFGPILGRVISLCYLWYFFQLSTLILRNYGDFLNIVSYPETPLPILLIMGCILTAYAVKAGIEVIARCATILVPFTLFIIMLTAFLLLSQMEFSNFLPIINKPWKDVLLAGHSIAVFPFGEAIAFLMIIPLLNKPAQAKSSLLMAYFITLLFLLLSVIRDTTVLGPMVDVFLYHSHEAVRLINIAQFITRIEISIAGSLLSLGFLKMSVLYYATAVGLSVVFKLRSYLPLVFPLGALIVCLSLLQFESNMEALEFANKVYPYYSLFFQLFLPGLTLLVSYFRQKPAKGVKK